MSEEVSVRAYVIYRVGRGKCEICGREGDGVALVRFNTVEYGCIGAMICIDKHSWEEIIALLKRKGEEGGV